VQNLIGRVIVLVLVMIFNYIASKFWIFKKKTQDE
jgi:putative flippase GtrA